VLGGVLGVFALVAAGSGVVWWFTARRRGPARVYWSADGRWRWDAKAQEWKPTGR
jgi:hypothetical protein